MIKFSNWKVAEPHSKSLAIDHWKTTHGPVAVMAVFYWSFSTRAISEREWIALKQLLKMHKCTETALELRTCSKPR